MEDMISDRDDLKEKISSAISNMAYDVPDAMAQVERLYHMTQYWASLNKEIESWHK